MLGPIGAPAQLHVSKRAPDVTNHAFLAVESREDLQPRVTGHRRKCKNRAAVLDDRITRCRPIVSKGERGLHRGLEPPPVFGPIPRIQVQVLELGPRCLENRLIGAELGENARQDVAANVHSAIRHGNAVDLEAELLDAVEDGARRLVVRRGVHRE